MFFSSSIIGILNTTPDSFSDGGQHNTLHAALAHADKLLEEGADIIDIGGESTRPGAAPTPPEEEIRRTIPLIAALRARHPQALLSIDTRRPETAAAALQAGVNIINDITGLTNPAMLQLCAQHPTCGIILMHMQGTPATMQQNPQYNDVVAEVRAFFEERVAAAEAAGISPARICLDPGFGFGKTTEHNLALLRNLEQLRVRNCPILSALSRKRFIGHILTGTPAPVLDPLPTVAFSLLAAQHGANLHRVHDVAPLAQALRLRNALLTEA